MKELRYAIVQSIPVMLGYLFLGFAFGLMLNDAGYGFWWAFFISLFVYAGSMQFVLVTLLTAGASLWYTLIMTLFVNGRHIFYGLSFVENFKKTGITYPYMIFSLTDETFSLLCDLKVPEGMREERVSFYISLLDHCYWILGSCVGELAGRVLPIDTTGIDFSMTALFTVIVVNQWMDTKEHKPAVIGGVVGVLCLLVLGADTFLLPALTIAAIILLGVKKKCYIPSNHSSCSYCYFDHTGSSFRGIWWKERGSGNSHISGKSTPAGHYGDSCYLLCKRN